jgi:ribonuclease P protein component
MSAHPGRTLRLRKGADILRVRKTGSKLVTENFIVYSTSCEDGGRRMAPVVPGRVANSPSRNRIKRLLREFFRQNLVPPGDYLIISKKSPKGFKLEDVRRELGAIAPGAKGVR